MKKEIKGWTIKEGYYHRTEDIMKIEYLIKEVKDKEKQKVKKISSVVEVREVCFFLVY